MKGYFHFAEKKGYSGVGIYTKETPTEVIVGIGNTPAFDEFNAEGRYVELRFDTPSRKFSIISCYYPSGSSGEERQQAKFRFLALIYPHLMQLKTEREFILCGDINIAHQEADLKNYKGNKKNSGFLPEERAWMTQVVARRKWWLERRLPPAAARYDRDLLHLVEQPWPSLCEQRGLALGLPLGDA